MLTRLHGRVGSADVRRSEQGQILILFLALFTVTLALAAFAIDQGLWYGKRRVAQKDVDAASRAGAMVLLVGDGVHYGACSRAEQTAGQNGATLSTLSATIDGCEADRVCVTARSEREVGSLFARLFNIDSIEIGAEAVACAGSAQGVHAHDNDSGPNGIPIVLAPTGNSRECIDDVPTNLTLQVGRECVIWGARNNDDGNLSTGFFASPTEHNRLLWDDPDGGCVAPNNIGDLSQIRDGVEWICHDKDNYVDVTRKRTDQSTILGMFASRLQGTANNCNSLEESNPNSFHNSFDWADGAPDAEPPPPFPLPGFASDWADRDAAYVQNDCLDNPRLVILPMTLEVGANGGAKQVNGIAVVYITGCYERQSALQESQPDGLKQTETNDCTNDTSPGTGHNYNSGFTDDTEVRGVPLRVFITQGALGDLGEIDVHDYPLTIQTCRTVAACTQ